ncbi:hypothetical protein C8N42_10534 [Celeribacter persicus]|uniref:Uncharacterized protein n=1 Tax=Celeribacter persicus TaxID=1651082 RepID=A0A2T5HP65_9RHOB|nr:hypothetical protein C8N42_10534 [Celeribacter persicus]
MEVLCKYAANPTGKILDFRKVLSDRAAKTRASNFYSKLRP